MTLEIHLGEWFVSTEQVSNMEIDALRNLRADIVEAIDEAGGWTDDDDISHAEGEPIRNIVGWSVILSRVNAEIAMRNEDDE